MISCTRRLHFCAGHRVFLHGGKCEHPHGHNYVVFVTAVGSGANGAAGLDDIGRVIDFSVLKEKVGAWIDRRWDHGFIYSVDDSAMADWFMTRASWKSFPLPNNPTAENMAEFLLRTVCPQVLVGKGVTVTRIRLWETENCFADAIL